MTRAKWHETVRATPRAVLMATGAVASLASLSPDSLRARRIRDRIARHLTAYAARLSAAPATVHILQWTEGGIPSDPEVFRTAQAAGAAMARYVRESAETRHPFLLEADGTPGAVTMEEMEAGEVGYLSDESGDRELRLWEIPISEVTP